MSDAQRADRAASLQALAHESARAAAAAFGQICGVPALALNMRLCTGAGIAGAGKFETGIVFEADGAVRGIVALLFADAGRAAVLEALGAEAMAESALSEVSNIVASYLVSAASDRLDARITLSVPSLLREDAGRAVARLLAWGRDMVVTATCLRGSGDAPEVVLVFAVEAR